MRSVAFLGAILAAAAATPPRRILSQEERAKKEYPHIPGRPARLKWPNPTRVRRDDEQYRSHVKAQAGLTARESERLHKMASSRGIPTAELMTRYKQVRAERGGLAAWADIL
jgi:hypothetical protein